MSLAEILPELADELAALVRQRGASELAAQVPHVGAGMSFALRFAQSPNLKVNTVLAMTA